MSAKSIIQGMEDSELIRMFLDFVQAYRLHYEKNHKEISYKCYEATWIINVAKATGYGRSETEAYKNGLKNLLELLMEDPQYSEFFGGSGPATEHTMKKSSPSAKMQLKTEGHQPEDKEKNLHYESYARNSSTKIKLESGVSRTNLSRSISQKGELELEEARNKMKTLETRLAAVMQENRVLREQLINSSQRPSFKKEEKPTEKAERREERRTFQAKIMMESESTDKNMVYLQERSSLGPYTQAHEKTLTVQRSQKCFIQPTKLAIPKLNLQVLPNYHKKSEKCLNDVLLAAYNDKHADRRPL